MHRPDLSWRTFARRHPLIANLVWFAIAALPQWGEAVWSLFTDEPLIPTLKSISITLPPFSASWITIPLGLTMAVLLIYELRYIRRFREELRTRIIALSLEIYTFLEWRRYEHPQREIKMTDLFLDPIDKLKLKQFEKETSDLFTGRFSVALQVLVTDLEMADVSISPLHKYTTEVYFTEDKVHDIATKLKWLSSMPPLVSRRSNVLNQ